MDLFEKLRGSPQTWHNSSSVPEELPFFVITTGEHGAAIAVLDKKRKPWSHSYQFFQGAVREALKAIEAVQAQSSAGFMWEEESDEILLANNEHLMRVLERTGRIFNARLVPISVEDKEATIVVSLERSADTFQAFVRLRKDGVMFDKFELLTDSRLLVDDTRIIKVPAMGSGFVHLPLFATRFQEDELSRYLTLLYSTLDQVSLDYEDYKYQEGD